MNINDIQTTRQLLDRSTQISIIPHKNPDGDAIGSCLGLYHFLTKKGYQVKVVSPTDYPSYLKWLPASEDVLIYTENKEAASNWIAKSNLIFTLDFNALYRADTLEQYLQESTAAFIMIDHHQEPAGYAQVTFSDVKASSTCELVYRFIDSLGERTMVNQTIATCLYTGIMTDTGCFKYATTTAQTHRIVASLIEKGIDVTEINSLVFDSFSYNRLKLLGRTLENMVLLPTYHTAYITLKAEELKEFQFEKGDTEGFVNYGLKMKDILLAVIFIEEEKEGIIKISFRSKEDLDVNFLARKYFSGGGHINASGGKYDGTLAECVAKFESVLPEFLSLPESRNKTE